VGAPFAAVPAGYMGAPTQQEFSSTAGTLNKCSLGGYQSIIPETHRYGLSAAANYTFNSEIEGFAELMYSRVLEVTAVVPPLLYGAPGYQSYTMSASNPYNPFGETVGVSGLLSGLGQEATSFNTTFLRPLVGIRGRLLDRWHWELAGWMARDQSSIPTSNIINSGALQNALDSADPTHALNLFSPGSPTAGSVLQSVVYAPNQETATIEGRTVAANAFVSGTAFNLPSGPVNIVAGAEYDKDALRESGGIADGTPYPSTAFDRTSHAFFGEARVPIIRGPSSQHSDTLVLNVAGRYDSYSDFGHKLTPQFSAELRPTGSVLLRASYGKAFRAPPLGFVHATVLQLPYPIVDPQRGNQTEIVNLVYGGNPTLQPETGNSRTLGVVYTSDAIPGLRLSATNWQIDEHNSIQLLNPQVMVNNSDLFPGRVVRGPSQGGQLGPITDLTDTYVNFGAISVAGIDYQVSYKYQSRLGQMSPLISVTQTYRYSYALAPNAPGIDSLNNAQDAGTWAPRWKGNLQLGWERGPYSATVGSRYLGKYRDYDALPNGTFLSLGNFWLFDMSFRYAIGGAVARSNSWLRRTQLSVGASNVFNRLPQFSNTGGYGGYDPAEGDIRGRFLYAQLAIKW
jgi:iron complex outermembrane receptor protein